MFQCDPSLKLKSLGEYWHPLRVFYKIVSKEPRKNSLQTFQKSVEITYANRRDEHEIECFHFYYGEPVLGVD